MEVTASLNSFITDVRVLMRDAAGEHNYSDSTILSGVVEGFKRMWSIRPSSRYIGGELVDQKFPQDTAQWGEFNISFNDRWRRGLIYYAAAMCYETGIPDAVNLQMANTMKQQADGVFMT